MSYKKDYLVFGSFHSRGIFLVNKMFFKKITTPILHQYSTQLKHQHIHTNWLVTLFWFDVFNKDGISPVVRDQFRSKLVPGLRSRRVRIPKDEPDPGRLFRVRSGVRSCPSESPENSVPKELTSFELNDRF